MKHVATLSYGIGSWAAAKLVVSRHGVENTVCVLTDTNYEDEDTYAWGEAAVKNIGAPFARVSDGRDIWQVFADVRLLGNTHHDPCSRVLKREALLKYLANNYDPSDTTVYFGIHWTESDRFSRQDRKTGKWLGIKHRMAAFGWNAEAPLCEAPFIPYEELHSWAQREGLWKQRLYQLGFPHANCGGRCVKQGHKGWRHLLDVMPERYKECEVKEEEIRQHIGKDIAILRDRTGGKTRGMTLREFRERIEAGAKTDENDWGGCNCFGGVEEDGQLTFNFTERL